MHSIAWHYIWSARKKISTILGTTSKAAYIIEYKDTPRKMCSGGTKAASSQAQQEAQIPTVAKAWLSIYHAIPKLHVPYGDLDFSFALFSALMLSCVRFLAEYVLIQSFGWPTAEEGSLLNGTTATKEAAACCASICHSSLLCVGLIVAFATQRCDPISKRTDHPQWWQDFADALLQFCTGYMVYDAVINIVLLRWDPQTHMLPIFNDDDKLFLVHHVMTSFYMTSARAVGAGHMSAMMCMLLGEMTNPLHNLYMLGEVAMTQECCNGQAAQRRHAIISVAFAAMYNLFRAVFSPTAMVFVTYRLLLTKRGRTNVPLPLNIVWNLMIWAVIFGSFSWMVKCQGILNDFYMTTFSGANVSSKESEL